MAAQGRKESASVEGQVRSVSLVIIVASLVLSGVGFVFKPTSESSPKLSAIAEEEIRSEELTYVLLEIMTTIAVDRILVRPKDIPAHTEFIESHRNHGHAPDQALLVQQLASQAHVSVICQVGLLAGHSAMLLLSSAPQAKMYLFDKLELIYSGKITSVISRVFPDRYNVVQADPVDSMVWFQKQDIMCDLSIVDHNKETALTDLINTIKVTTIGKVIMANEMYGFEEDWDKVVKAGYISKSKCDEIAAAKRKWCFGTVAKHKGSLDGEILIATETDFQFNVLSGSALPYTTPPGNPLG